MNTEHQFVYLSLKKKVVNLSSKGARHIYSLKVDEQELNDYELRSVLKYVKKLRKRNRGR